MKVSEITRAILDLADQGDEYREELVNCGKTFHKLKEMALQIAQKNGDLSADDLVRECLNLQTPNYVTPKECSEGD